MSDWLFNWLTHVARAATSAQQWAQLGPSIVAGVIAALVAVYVAKYTVAASTREQDRVAKLRTEDDGLRRVSETLYQLLTGMDDIAAQDAVDRPTAYLRIAKKIDMAVVTEAPTIRPPMRDFLVRLSRAAIRAFVVWDQEVGAAQSAAARQRIWSKYRRLLDRLALDANWQIGQWRSDGAVPSSSAFDDIDKVLIACLLPDTTQASTDAVQIYLLRTRTVGRQR